MSPTPATVPSIRTARVDLVSMSMPFMRALAAGDVAAAEAEMGATIPPDMPTDLADFLGFRIPDLAADPTIQAWLGRSIVLDTPDGRRVIGSIGFHAPPDADGRVEIGYRIEPEHRRQGLATEVVGALLDWARREHGIRRFRASTAPDNVASQAILARLGFKQVGTQMDEIDGLELVFQLDDLG